MTITSLIVGVCGGAIIGAAARILGIRFWHMLIAAFVYGIIFDMILRGTI